MRFEETVYIKMGLLGMPDEAMQSYILYFDTENPDEAIFESQLNATEATAKLQVEFSRKIAKYMMKKIEDSPEDLI
jgi:hypothetical protein